MSRQELWFSVVGVEPAPQGSKRHVGGGRLVEASKKVAPFRKAVGDAARVAVEASGDGRVFTDPVVVWAVFWLPRPSTVKRLLPSVPPDTDKLCRALLDGLEQNGQVIASDSLVVDIHAKKRYARDLDKVGVDVLVKSFALAASDTNLEFVDEKLAFFEKAN